MPILQHRYHRNAAVRWAERLRFLTFAGGEGYTYAKMPEGSDSTKKKPTPGSMHSLWSASFASGRTHMCYPCSALMTLTSRRTRNEPKTVPTLAYTSKNASCEECLQIALFPDGGKASKNSHPKAQTKGARGRSELGLCTHFVAVSYCWSSPSAQKSGEPDTDGEPYQVIEEDVKTVRPIRAPKDKIDRAVGLAAQIGFRMILGRPGDSNAPICPPEIYRS